METLWERRKRMGDKVVSEERQASRHYGRKENHQIIQRVILKCGGNNQVSMSMGKTQAAERR